MFFEQILPSIIAAIRANVELVGVLTFLVGGMVFYWLKDSRRRQNELNAASARFYLALKEQHSRIINTKGINQFVSGLDRIELLIPWYRRSIYNHRVAQYTKAYKNYVAFCCEGYDPQTGMSVDSSAHIQKIAPYVKKLMWHTKQR